MYSRADALLPSMVCPEPVTVTLDVICKGPLASVIRELRRFAAKAIESSPAPATQLLVPALSVLAESIAWRSVHVMAVPASPPVVTVIVAASAAGTPKARAIASGNSRRERSEMDFITAPEMQLATENLWWKYMHAKNFVQWVLSCELQDRV